MKCSQTLTKTVDVARFNIYEKNRVDSILFEKFTYVDKRSVTDVHKVQI